MAEQVTIREVSSVEDVRAVAALLERVWQEPRILTPELLRALATHGNLVLGAFQGDRMVGAQVAFLAMEDGRHIVHSHVTGVVPEVQHRGVGLLLKRAQRDWALGRGIDVITWTFDPMIARNAYFNLRKLGAAGRRFLRDFYGPMEDAFNAGERSDRLEVEWGLLAPRVERALAGGTGDPDVRAAAVVVEDVDGAPGVNRTALDVGHDRLLLKIPSDYLALRRADPEAAAAWRDAVADILEEAFDIGFKATDFVREGAYLLERT